MKKQRPAPWSNEEDRLIVRDYLDMMAALGRAEKINKAATRRALMTKLNNRSEGSVEFKRCNISAVLVLLGRTWLPGYRPAENYQRGLIEIVKQELALKAA